MELIISVSLFFVPFFVIISIVSGYHAYMDKKKGKVFDVNIEKIKQLSYEQNNDIV